MIINSSTDQTKSIHSGKYQKYLHSFNAWCSDKSTYSAMPVPDYPLYALINNNSENRYLTPLVLEEASGPFGQASVGYLDRDADMHHNDINISLQNHHMPFMQNVGPRHSIDIVYSASFLENCEDLEGLEVIYEESDDWRNYLFQTFDMCKIAQIMIHSTNLRGQMPQLVQSELRIDTDDLESCIIRRFVRFFDIAKQEGFDITCLPTVLLATSQPADKSCAYYMHIAERLVTTGIYDVRYNGDLYKDIAKPSELKVIEYIGLEDIKSKVMNDEIELFDETAGMTSVDTKDYVDFLISVLRRQLSLREVVNLLDVLPETRSLREEILIRASEELSVEEEQKGQEDELYYEDDDTSDNAFFNSINSSFD